MKKLPLFLLITLIFAFTFNGCAADDNQKLIGAWKYDYNISELFNDAFNEDSTEAYSDLEEHRATVVLTFNEDGTYFMTFDDASLKTALDEIKTELIAESEDYVKKLIADEGLIYQLFADSVAQEIQEETEKEINKMVDEIYRELSAGETGAFSAEDGKLYMQENVQTVTDTYKYEVYTLEGNILTLIEDVGYEEDDSLYPIVFTKAE